MGRQETIWCLPGIDCKWRPKKESETGGKVVKAWCSVLKGQCEKLLGAAEFGEPQSSAGSCTSSHQPLPISHRHWGKGKSLKVAHCDALLWCRLHSNGAWEQGTPPKTIPMSHRESKGSWYYLCPLLSLRPGWNLPARGAGGTVTYFRSGTGFHKGTNKIARGARPQDFNINLRFNLKKKKQTETIFYHSIKLKNSQEQEGKIQG